jgi:twitching motility two-component system response regulator PilG
MNSKKAFTVFSIGFSKYDQNVLKSIFWLSRSRLYSYNSTSELNPSVHIVIVDLDNPDAVAQWSSFRDNKPDLPTILVAKVRPLHQQYFYVQRPFSAMGLLSVLDEAASQLFQAASSSDPGRQSGGEKPQERVSGMVSPSVGEKQTKPGQHYKALVVDENAAVRNTIQNSLAALGMQVDFAQSAKETFAYLTLDCIKQSPYDLIFINASLPDKSGYQVCKRIKRDKVHRQTPVILLNKETSLANWIKGKLAGCNTQLRIPVTHQTLLATMTQYLPIDDILRNNLHDMSQLRQEKQKRRSEELSQYPSVENTLHGKKSNISILKQNNQRWAREKWYLEGIVDEGKTWIIDLQTLPFVVGRDKSCQLRLNSPEISRRHAELFEKNGALWVREYGSTNGTFVNHERLTGDRVLHDGEVIRFGSLAFRIGCKPAELPVSAMDAEPRTQLLSEAMAHSLVS